MLEYHDGEFCNTTSGSYKNHGKLSAHTFLFKSQGEPVGGPTCNPHMSPICPRYSSYCSPRNGRASLGENAEPVTNQESSPPLRSLLTQRAHAAVEYTLGLKLLSEEPHWPPGIYYTATWTLLQTKTFTIHLHGPSRKFQEVS